LQGLDDQTPLCQREDARERQIRAPESRRPISAGTIGVRTSARGVSRSNQASERNKVDLQETLEKIVELSREELHIVRKRAEEKTPARDHGKDYHEAQAAADRLDHYAHQLYRLHDAEYADGWRHHSAGDRN
jgi:hypothetical protein